MLIRNETPADEAVSHSYSDGVMNPDSSSGSSINWGTANNILGNNGAVIFGLDFPNNKGEYDGQVDHFVLAVGYSNGKYYINDPFFASGKQYSSSSVIKLLRP